MTAHPPGQSALPSDQPDVVSTPLATFGNALRDLGPVLAPALGILTASEVELALNSIPLRERRPIMKGLGFPNMVEPRRFGRALSEQVLRRLQRLESEYDQRHAVRHLTVRIDHEIRQLAYGTVDRATSHSPVERWGQTLARLSVFAQLSGEWFDAPLVIWAADNDWLGINLDVGTTARDALLKSAQQLLETPPTVDSQDKHEGGDSAIDRESETVAASLVARLSPEALSSLQARLESVFGHARIAVRQVLAALDDGYAPDTEDLASLAAVGPAMVQVADALAVAGSEGVAPRLVDIIHAVHGHRAAAERDAALRVALGTLLTFTCPPDGPVGPGLAQAISQAQQLLSTDDWNAADLDRAKVLSLLVELVELGDRSASAEAVQEAARRLTESDPSYAVAAVLYTEITRRGAPAAKTPAGADPAVVPGTSTDPAAIEDSKIPAELPSLPAPLAVSVETGRGEEDHATPVQELTGSGEEVPEAGDALPEAADGSQTTGDAARATVDEVSEVDRPVLNSGPPVAAGLGAGGTDDVSESGPIQPRDVEAALVTLVAQKRFGLAAHLSHAAGRPEAEGSALRLAGLGGALRHRSDKVAAAFTSALVDAVHDDGFHTQSDEGLPLLLLPALANGALLTGEHVYGAELRVLANRLPGVLSEVAAQIAEPTLSGALLIAPLSSVAADVTEAEARVVHAQDACRGLLTPPRMRFQRASRMMQQWLKPTGVLGSVLFAIVDGASDADVRADGLLEELARRPRIEDLIDRMDEELRASAPSIQGAGRNNVRQQLERVREAVRLWRDARRDVGTRRSRENSWAFEAAAALRSSLIALHPRIEADLRAAGRHAVPLIAAAAAVAADTFTTLFTDVLEGGTRRPARTVDADALLDAELLKVRLAPDDEVSVEGLLKAVHVSWDDAVAFQIGHDGFSAVHSILTLQEQGLLPAARTLSPEITDHARLESEENRRRTELAERNRRLVADLGHAQAAGALTVDQDVHLQELLADAEPHTEAGAARELFRIRRNLDQVDALIPRHRDEAATRLRARLDELDKVSSEARKQFERLLATDNLATAAELVYFLELDEPVPEIRSQESHLNAFFPAVPDALGAGITRELIERVRARSRFEDLPALDYSGLSPEGADRAARALAQWTKLAGAQQRHQINPRIDLTPALGLLGYEATKVSPQDDLPRGQDYRFFELIDVQVTGRAWAPAFGSQIEVGGRKLRTLLIWDRPSAQLLLSRIRQDPGDNSLLVVHFGTLDSRTRIALAVASQGSKPIMVVDDAALAYLAANGNQSVDATTETLLPFSAVNPYIKEKRGRIGREMFYGRDKERKSILDPQGTQILYGGRGLGKSALLVDAGDRFEAQLPHAHRTLYVNLDKTGISKGTVLGAAAIWTTLDQELTIAGVLEEPRRKLPVQEPWQRVTQGVARWLGADPDRRLLVLLDECDRFFEADVPDCNQTRRLRGLGDDSNGRAKVVFAGLHSVQRFTRLARNGPFSHLAQTPTVVGPLTPQFAADLLVHPMRALGFEFTDVDLVNRVLGFCSYQPFLLQIFGSRMVQGMQNKRVRLQHSAPPYAIEAADVDGVEQDPSLRSDIRAAFKDTLALDDRYNVVANVLAQHARDNGLETRLSDRELRDECAGWWQQGFEELDGEGFRAYLEEMVGLGVLAPNHDGRGWHLRGPNALRMIGTAHEIEACLLGAEREYRLEDTVVLESRLEMSDKRSAPLTIDQIDYLLGSGGNQVRVVLGTRATGIDDVGATLREATGRVAGWTVPAISKNNAFRSALAEGRPHERRLIVSELANKSAKACRDSLDQSRMFLPNAPETSRSVVLVSGAAQLDFWRELLVSTDADDHGLAMTLRRYDLRALKDWTQRHSLCQTEERVASLHARTGGWPYLLDKALSLRRGQGDHDRVLRLLSEWIGEKGGAEEFVGVTGIAQDEELWASYIAIAEHAGLGWNSERDYLAALHMAEIGSAASAQANLACLGAMQAFDRDGAKLRIEPVLFQAVTVLGAVV